MYKGSEGNLIGKVQVGGMWYDIVEVPVVDRDGLILGRIKYLEQEIRLDQAMSPEKKRFALAHEIVHGILTEAGYVNESDNEQLVTAIARGILEVIDQDVPIVCKQLKSSDFKRVGDAMVQGFSEGIKKPTFSSDEICRYLNGEGETHDDQTT